MGVLAQKSLSYLNFEDQNVFKIPPLDPQVYNLFFFSRFKMNKLENIFRIQGAIHVNLKT